MAKHPTSRRPARSGGSNAMTYLFLVGSLIECVLLLTYRFLVRGTVRQTVFTAHALEFLSPFGLVLFCVGLVLFLLRGRFARPQTALFAAMVCVGAFLCVVCRLMRAFPPYIPLMCVAVLVVMLLGAVCLLYPREFAAQATALTLLIGCAALLNRSFSSGIARAATVLCSLALAVGAVLLLKLQKGDGCFAPEKRVLPRDANYALLLGVTALCLAGNCAALLLAGAAYYVVWAGAILLFVLAVWYTVKLM